MRAKPAAVGVGVARVGRTLLSVAFDLASDFALNVASDLALDVASDLALDVASDFALDVASDFALDVASDFALDVASDLALDFDFDPSRRATPPPAPPWKSGASAPRKATRNKLVSFRTGPKAR